MGLHQAATFGCGLLTESLSLQAQCKQVKEKLGAALLDSNSPAKITSDFASFPSAQLSKVLRPR